MLATPSSSQLFVDIVGLNQQKSQKFQQFRELTTKQKLVCWTESIMCGFCHRTGCKCETDTKNSQEKTQKNQTESGSVCLLRMICEAQPAPWLLQNCHLHGNDPVVVHSCKHQQLSKQVEELHRKWEWMLTADQRTCNVDKEDWTDGDSQHEKTGRGFASTGLSHLPQQVCGLWQGCSFRKTEIQCSPHHMFWTAQWVRLMEQNKVMPSQVRLVLQTTNETNDLRSGAMAHTWLSTMSSSFTFELGQALPWCSCLQKHSGSNSMRRVQC